MDIFILIFPLLAGWLLDKLIGDPLYLPHPVVGFGKLISFFEKRWNRGMHRVGKGRLQLSCLSDLYMCFLLC